MHSVSRKNIERLFPLFSTPLATDFADLLLFFPALTPHISYYLMLMVSLTRNYCSFMSFCVMVMKKMNLGHPHETLCVTSVTLVVNWHHHVSLRQTGNVNGNKCACASISNPKIILLLSMLNMLLWEIIRTLLQCRLPRHLLTSCNAN